MSSSVKHRPVNILITILSILIITMSMTGVRAQNFSKLEKVNFSVKFKDDLNPYRVLGIFLMPGEKIEFECVFTDPQSTFMITPSKGVLEPVSKERWRWKAPHTKGMYTVTITEMPSQNVMVFHAFVMVPFQSKNSKLNDYRIGQYQQKPLKNNPVYAPPQGFIEVTKQNRHELVSPHFTLGQFVSKQPSKYPKYVALRERLLLKLEMILEAVQETGRKVKTLHVMSGFRTPFYNKAIGNPTLYSRHLYGDAADIFIDQDQNNIMDDLDHDGKTTLVDAQRLANIIIDKSKEAWYRPFIGGLGVYGPRSHRGPFVHVDVRGTPARWSNP
ncbi:MAG: hypothetical protein NPIRA04_24040 [Nitrospirales bacterium]|nr:MAG: hypothetical protein NPIRA04_24040 [Nitrospirales bacterium]